MTSVNVPPTSTPIRTLFSVVAMQYLCDMKSQIASGVQFVRLPRESLEQRVTEMLRELIISGELPEGTPLVQRDLAHRIGVSQTPVRIGLSELARDGLVEVTGTGRALVSKLTREDLEEIYAARLGLEGLAARVGAAALSDDEITRMQKLMRELERLAKKRDVDAYLRVRWDFHAICYAASGRTRLVTEVERLFWRAERYNRLVLSTAARFHRSVGFYHAFLEACEARDGDAAERVIHESVRATVDDLAPSLPSESDVAVA
jgi:DNA-binding GntR family transcriptional regulator